MHENWKYMDLNPKTYVKLIAEVAKKLFTHYTRHAFVSTEGRSISHNQGEIVVHVYHDEHTISWNIYNGLLHSGFVFPSSLSHFFFLLLAG